MIDKNMLNSAIDLSLKGKFEEAEKIYKILEKETPDNEILFSAMGLFYAQMQNFDEACLYLKKAIDKNPSVGNLSALGFCEYEKGDYDKASEFLEKSLDFGSNEEIYDKLISSLFELKRYSSAIKYSLMMYEKYPQSEKSVAHMVKSLTHQGKTLDAEKMCVDYLKENINSGLLWTHLGYLKELIYGDDKQAYECFKQSYKLGYYSSLYNIAISANRQKKYAESENAFKQSLKLFPNNSGIKVSYGMCLLEQKKFEEGYKYYFDRDKSFWNKFSNNFWKPGDKFDENMTIVCDQGFGDNIQFIRYLPILKEKVKKLTLAVREPLKTLFENNYPFTDIINIKEINSEEQVLFITDMAYALGMNFENIPYSNGYLKSEVKDIKSDKPKIGICWEAGSAGIRTMLNRTININLFEEILNFDNFQFYSFQVDDTLDGNNKFPQMINIAKDFKDFNDTSMSVMAMDLIITVDTALAHLAGALGKKTFLLLPYITDWRWFNDNKKSPWYDSIEIFKQDDPISWEKPLKDVLCALKEYFL